MSVFLMGISPVGPWGKKEKHHLFDSLSSQIKTPESQEIQTFGLKKREEN
jgi:hypothetical protein